MTHAKSKAKKALPVTINDLVPVLPVEAIEPCLPFWIERLGFSLVADVKDGPHLGFALLMQNGVQVMYQTRASLAKDCPSLTAHDRQSSVFLYLGVEDLDAIEAAMRGLPRVLERRTTFYGAHEFAVREPGGHVVTFSQRVAS